MADRPQPHQLQVHAQRPYQEGGFRTQFPQKTGGGPAASKVIAVLTLLPVGGTLLTLAGLTLAGTLLGLAVSTPVFIVFSPILVLAAIVIALAVTGILTSGAFGLTAVSSLAWVYEYVRRVTGMTGMVPEQIDHAKRRMQDVAVYVRQKTKDVGQEIQSKAQDQPRRT